MSGNRIHGQTHEGYIGLREEERELEEKVVEQMLTANSERRADVVTRIGSGRRSDGGGCFSLSHWGEEMKVKGDQRPLMYIRLCLCTIPVTRLIRA